jgi:hypothetical protein
MRDVFARRSAVIKEQIPDLMRQAQEAENRGDHEHAAQLVKRAHQPERERKDLLTRG